MSRWTWGAAGLRATPGLIPTGPLFGPLVDAVVALLREQGPLPGSRIQHALRLTYSNAMRDARQLHAGTGWMRQLLRDDPRITIVRDSESGYGEPVFGSVDTAPAAVVAGH